MLAVALDAFFKEIGTVDGLIAAGDETGDPFAGPERRAYFVAVILVEAVDEAVEDVLQRSRTVPRVDGRGQDDEVALEDGVCNGRKLVAADAGKMLPVLLTAAAGVTRIDLIVIEPKDLVLMAEVLQFVAERVETLFGVAVLSGTAHKNGDFHRSPFTKEGTYRTIWLKTSPMASWRTRSAALSMSVVDLLMSTSFLPR